MKKSIFVDGQSGTTGLKIHDYLKKYQELDLITIPYEERRDPAKRAKCLNEADIVFLCLPDDASREAVSLISNPSTRVIDASTAYRACDDWAYGIPELSAEHREAIRTGKRVSNPGCYASAFTLAVFPLVHYGVMQQDYPLSIFGLTGYSGGGKALIEKYEANEGDNPYTKAPRPYGLSLNHKHLPEMMMRTGITRCPVFLPVVCDYYKGMGVSVPVHTELLQKNISVKAIHELLEKHYAGEAFVKVMPYQDESFLFDGGLDVTACNDTNCAEIFIFGNESKGTAMLLTRLDNLGKGASGAAIQNMNLMLGLEETLHFDR